MLVAIAGGCVDSDVSRVLGARCDVKEECDERCLAPDPRFPGGFCTLSCATDDDCPSQALCIEDEGGVCVFGCRIAQSCDFLGEGWSCRPATANADGSEVMVCIGV